MARTRRIERLEKRYQLICDALDVLAAAGIEPPPSVRAEHASTIEKIARHRAALAVRDCPLRVRRQARPRRVRQARTTAARVSWTAPRRRGAAGRKKDPDPDPEPAGGDWLVIPPGKLMSPLFDAGTGKLAVVPPDARAEAHIRRSDLWPRLDLDQRWTIRQLLRREPFTDRDAAQLDRVLRQVALCALPGRPWLPGVSGPLPTLRLLIRNPEGLWRLVADVDLNAWAGWQCEGSA